MIKGGNEQKQNKGLVITLIITKIVAVLIIAGVVTYLTDQFHYFQEIEKNVEYGIWHGFPLGFYFEGYHVNWGDGVSSPFADWVPLHRWNYYNIACDFLIYAIFVGSVLFLIEKGLKKLLKIQW